MVMVAAIALRVFPLHVHYRHSDERNFAIHALNNVAGQTWRPGTLSYPTGFSYVLTATYSMALRLGQWTHRFQDRFDLLATFVREPFPFLLPARGLCAALGILTVLLLVGIGDRDR